MIEIKQEVLTRFFKMADGKVTGEFVIIGGSVLPLLGIDLRVTLDIDLVNLDEASSGKNALLLMEIAQDLGLPIEAINPTGAFFVYKIPDWRNSLVAAFKGKTVNFYRPNTSLFLTLKINRMSESDLIDCLEMLKYAKSNKELIEKQKLLSLIDSQTEKGSEPQKVRLTTLRRKLEK